IPGATAAQYVLEGVDLADDGAAFSVVVQNAYGQTTSLAAILSVSENTPPLATILTPEPGATYAAGTTLGFSGAAEDTEDGSLPPSAFSWRIDFHHAEHLHPAMPET